LYDIRNLNIWKEGPAANTGPLDENETRELTAFGKTVTVYMGRELLDRDLSELSLSVRSFNCLKRAGCSTVGDIVELCGGEDGNGLMRVRNLGARSGEEILDRISAMQEEMLLSGALSSGRGGRKKALVRPAGKTMDRRIESFPISLSCRDRLSSCGIRTVRDLYRQGMGEEPGWYAVRELFEKISADPGR
jgi:DNA-directed RNA polymerase alpha subunit